MTSPNSNSRLHRASISSRSPTPTSSPRLYSSPHRGSKTHLPQPKVLPFPDLPVRPTLSRDSSSNNLLTTSSTHGESSGSRSFGGVPMMAGGSSDGERFHVVSSPPIPSPLGSSSRVASGSSESNLPIARPASSGVSGIPTPSRIQGFQPVASTSPVTSIPSVTLHDRNHAQTQSPREAKIPATPSKKPSLPVPSVMTSISITPPSSGQPMLDHMYQCFLKGIRADVRLWVRKWGIGWMVHSSVLVQAGFFHSLFLGGFSETSVSFRKGDGVLTDEWRGEDIELKFDDPNITRAAFELCLSRLYSPFPQLRFPTSYLPTPSQPLTPLFVSAPSQTLEEMHHLLPANEHLATPHLLLSLLATTIYLGQSDLMKEVLAMILRTVGPGTIVRYLGFAIGDGVGEEEWEGQTNTGARGLEAVGRKVTLKSGPKGKGKMAFDEDPDASTVETILTQSPSSHRGSTDSDMTDEESKVGDSRPPPLHLGPSLADKRTYSGDSESTLRLVTGMEKQPLDCSTSIVAMEVSEKHAHFYGFASNKIGEACMCWLARWAVDIVSGEMATTPPYSPIFGHQGLPSRFLRALLCSDSLWVHNEMGRYNLARSIVDLRRRGWETEVTGDDDSFEEGWELDEVELGRVFEEGIHYTHMTYDELSTIAADVDPHTSLPFVPMSVLQSAHWQAAQLKSRITSHERTSSSSVSTLAVAVDEDFELGLTQTTTEIARGVERRSKIGRSRVASPTSVSHGRTLSGTGVGSTSSMDSSPSSKVSTYSSLGHGGLPTSSTMYHPVPTDDTHRIGAGGLLFNLATQGPTHADSPITATGSAIHTIASISGLPDLGPDNEVDNATSRKNRTPPQGEATFFGLLGGKRTAEEIHTKWKEEGGPWSSAFSGLSLEPKPDERWSKIEPFRFSVEFWGVEKLAEKERAYSTTHFYAGSWFNVYVQTIRKKEKAVQLGIYLHRQSTKEPFPLASAPSAASDLGQGSTARGRSTSSLAALLSSPFSAGAMLESPSTGNAMLSTSPGVRSGAGGELAGVGIGPSEEGAYRDTRRVTKAYFSISCASALGTALIRFSSSPDAFTLSQSWGWKSSALRSEEYLVGGSAGEPGLDDGVLGWVGDLPTGGKPMSLRANVIVGVI